MRRVLVVGSGGAGKSTFADQLGAHTGLPVTHLDAHFWQPGWVETPRDQWRAVQERMVAADAWILDGNYSGTVDVRLSRADTVILLDLSRWRCVWRVMRRTIRHRGRDRVAPGCADRLDLQFVRWVYSYPTRSRPKVLAAVARHPAVELVRLRTPGQVGRYLADAASTGAVGGDR